MKHIIVLGDGMADHPLPELGGKTLLQEAHTPWMDLLARKGRVGRLITVPAGFHPGSEVANMSVLGYDLPSVYEGRGVLEAASMGIDLAPGELAMRCNLICIEDGRIKNHSAGHITTEEADELIRFLQEKLGNERIHFHTGIQYRHLLVVSGGSKDIETTPPHDVPGQPFRPLLARPLNESAKAFADLLNDLILKSQALLEEHPVNLRRQAAGKDKANSIWPWSPGFRPKMETLSARFPQVKSGSVISAVDLIRGIGRYAGLRSIEVEGATGLYDTNYEGKVAAAIEALRGGDDFVFLHIEASDEAGHEGDVQLKKRTIENLDARIVGPLYQTLSQWQDEPVAIAVLPDHPTPCALRTHVAEPVPFLIYYPGIEADSVSAYDEISAVEGSYGLMKEDEFIREFMKH
ncbi:MAG: cofactor-independent phosphoglycerate mutase [Bacteroidaceae bacterium]|jgi:2,3-bisphosphoglycerate-independent phosphoglycerate mutase